MASIDSFAALYVVLATLLLAALSTVFSRASFAYAYALWPGVFLIHLGLLAGWAALVAALARRPFAVAVEEWVTFAIFSVSSAVQIVKQLHLLNFALDFELLRAAAAAQLLSTWEARKAYNQQLDDADPYALASILFVWRVRLAAAPTLAPAALWFRMWQVRQKLRTWQAKTRDDAKSGEDPAANVPFPFLPVLASAHFVRFYKVVFQRLGMPECWFFRVDAKDSRKLKMFNSGWVGLYLFFYTLYLLPALPLIVLFFISGSFARLVVYRVVNSTWKEEGFGKRLMEAWLGDVLYAPAELSKGFGAWEVWQLGNAMTEERAQELLVAMTTPRPEPSAAPPPPANDKGTLPPTTDGTAPDVSRVAAPTGGALNESVAPATGGTRPRPTDAAASDMVEPVSTPAGSDTRAVAESEAGASFRRALSDARVALSEVIGDTDVPAGTPTSGPATDAAAGSAAHTGVSSRKVTSRELFLTYVLAALNLEALAANPSQPSCSLADVMDGKSGPLSDLYVKTKGTMKERWQSLHHAFQRQDTGGNDGGAPLESAPVKREPLLPLHISCLGRGGRRNVSGTA